MLASAMLIGMDEDRQRQLKRAAKDQEKASAQEAMVLDAAGLDALLDYLDARLESTACDHSLRLTRAWAVEHGLDADALAGSVEHFGGYCDCEVLANVEPEMIF